jgi:hypothetical protein
MFPILERGIHRIGWLSVAMLVAGSTGCNSINLPTFSAFSLGQSEPNYVSLGGGFELDSTGSEAVYYKVREARSQNSIVLQVVGDDPPIRILPLPPGQKSVFVSTLLKQTGVQKKLGAIDAVLFRHAKGTIGGIRMVVRMSPDKSTVRPETDYALKAGDRLRVEKAPNPSLQKLIDITLGQ